MRSRAWILVLLILASGLVLGPNCPSPPPPTDSQRVNQAVALLGDRDYVVVRNAIRELSNLLDAPNIMKAVNPLIQVMQGQDGFYDSYTRSMAAQALVQIGTSQGYPKGKKAMNAVIAELAGGDLDVVRADCAYDLGATDWEAAYEPLVSANENDPSPVVRSSACEALFMYTNGLYSSETCYYEESSGQMSAPVGALMAFGAEAGSPADASDPAMQRWIKDHVLLPPESLALPGSPQ